MADTKPTEAPVAQTMSDVDKVIETWWADMFPGSCVARNTETWNWCMAAKDELKKRLA